MPGLFKVKFPPYPGVPQPNHIQSCSWAFRRVVHLACLDGFFHGYYRAAERSYHREIGAIYNQAYHNAYSSAYQEALNAYYEQSHGRGLEEGTNEAFARVYPRVKEAFRAQEEQKFSTYPERTSNTYRDAFASSTREAYGKKYEEIRAASFAPASQKAYSENIDAQVEQFTQNRLQEVTGIYENYAVIGYVGFSYRDGGVLGVAKGDGIYQPEENIVYDVTLKNYGQQWARQVNVVLESGERITLPELPPQSVVTVKGAALSRVNAPVNGTGQAGVIVTKQLTSPDTRVEGRHFYDASSGQVNEKDGESFPVNYPLSINKVFIEGDLLLDQVSTYQVRVENNSQRSYDGPITFQVNTSLGKTVLLSSLAEISYLQRQLGVLRSGKLQVEQSSDALEELSFDVSLVKNGVVVGQVLGAGKKLVQIPYLEKEGAPVVLGNAVKDPKTLRDTIAEKGGVEQVSVLDLALPKSTAPVLKGGGLTGKILILGKEELDSEMMSALEEAMLTAPRLLVATDAYYDHHKSSLLSLNAMKSFVRQAVTIGGGSPYSLIFANSYATGAANRVMVMDLQVLEESPKMVALLMQEREALIANALNSLPPEEVANILVTKSTEPKSRGAIQALLLNVVMDALKADQIFQAYGKQEGKTAVRRAVRDPKFFHNRLGDHLHQAMNTRDVPKIISGVVILRELNELINNHPAVANAKSFVKKEMLVRPTKRMQSQLMKVLKEEVDGEFYRAFDGLTKSASFKGSYSPLAYKAD